MPRPAPRLPALIGAAVLVAAMNGLVPAASAEPVTGLALAQPKETASLAAGLGVRYLIAKFDTISEIELMATWKEPRVGTPIPMLNYNVGPDSVLTTKAHDLVGAFIDGFIKFDKPGIFLLAVQHNDGVRLSIGGKEIYDYPFVTPDNFSPNLEVRIDQPGWYPISLIYFEKRNTSTLELYWQPPGTDEFVFVPAEAFAHDPNKDTSS